MRPFILDQAYKKFGRQIALYDFDKDLEVSYEQYFLTVIRLKEVLQNDHNIQPNSSVGIYAENSLEYIYVIMALSLLGATLFHLNHRMPVQYIHTLLEEHQIKFLICDKIYEELRENYNIIVLESLTKLSYQSSVPQKNKSHWISKDQFVDVMFTSSTTGKPKAVAHTYANHYYSALGSNFNIALDMNDGWLLTLPLFHVSGMSLLYRTALAGARVILTQNLQKAILHDKVTHASLVATQLIRLLNKVDANRLSGIKILLGGSAIPHNLLHQCTQYSLQIFTTYGCSEMASQITTSFNPQQEQVLTHSGKCLKFREVILGEDNEIYLRGSVLSPGYLENGKLVSIRDSSGWYHSNDIGHWDKDNNLIIKGRKDNMFVCGGENIQPEEIEAILEAIEEVNLSIVVPIPNEELQFLPVAFLSIQHKTLPEILPIIEEECSNKLPRFKHPVAFFPLNITKHGTKPQRNQLKKEAYKLYYRTA